MASYRFLARGAVSRMRRGPTPVADGLRAVPAPSGLKAVRFFVTKRVKNDHLVRQVDRRRNRELRTAVVWGVVAVLIGLLYGWQHFEFIRVGYRMEELRLEEESLRKIHRQLSLEKASLVSPDRVEAIAFRDLGLQPPSREQWFVLETQEVR